MRSVESGISPWLVHNNRTVPIIYSKDYIALFFTAHARNGHVFTSGPKSDVTNMFLDPYFL